MKRYQVSRCGWVVCALGINLCAAAPPREGGEVGAAAGYGNYSYSTGGCGGPVYRNEATDLKGHVRGGYRSEQGWSVAVEGSVSHSEVTGATRVEEGENEPEPDAIQTGKQRWGYVGALRGGKHWAYGGLELGPAIHARSIVDPGNAENDPRLALSAMGWAGMPQYAYAWASVFEGPGSASFIPLSFGVGHAGERVRGALGFGPAQTQLMGQVEFLLPVEQAIWLGAMAHGKGAEDWGLMLMLSVPLTKD